jgi:hypothetical protein
MRCKLSTPGSPEYIPHVTLSISATPDPCTPPLPSPSSSSLYLRTPAIAQSSAKVSGGGGEKRIFPPQHFHRSTVTPLVLQVYFQDHTGSLDNPNMDIQSELMNYHLDILIGSTFRICSPNGNIFITLP